MACALTSDLTPKVCKTPGGVAQILVTEIANIATLTYTANVVTAFTLATGKQFRQYTTKAATSNFKQVGTAASNAGAYGYAYDLNFQLPNVDTATQEELELLMLNTLCVILKLNDGTYWVVGQEFGLDVTTDTLDSGTALADFHGNNIQMTGLGTLRAKLVTPALIPVLIVAAV